MRYRDFIQNITITFLALLSLFLFSRTQFFQLGAAAGSGTWQRLTAPVSRSEERRVGKECRSRWSPYH